MAHGTVRAAEIVDKALRVKKLADVGSIQLGTVFVLLPSFLVGRFVLVLGPVYFGAARRHLTDSLMEHRQDWHVAIRNAVAGRRGMCPSR
jgi:hypothetical protein